MPITLANLRRQVISRVQAEHVKASDLFPADLLDVWLTEAYIELQRDLRLVTATYTQDLTKDTVRFTAPSDILDHMVLPQWGVRVKSPDGCFGYLNERLWLHMTELYGDFSNPNSIYGPVDWCWDGNDQTRIVVFPPANTTVTSGLMMDYVVDPGELTGGYDPDTATCSVANGSTTVTFASSISGRVVAGDAFGVKAAADELPSRFYLIASVDSTTQITLDTAYTGTTDSAALFTLSPCSIIERKRPGLVRYAPVEYAMYRARQLHDGDEAAMATLSIWNNEKQRIREQSNYRPGLAFKGVDAYSRHPGLRNSRR